MIAFMVDTETGGLNPRACGLTEIAVIAFESDPAGNLTEKGVFHRILAPCQDLAYTPRALSIQGRTLEWLAENGTDERAAYGDFMAFLTEYGAQPAARYCSPGSMWAHNSAFDHGFVRAWSLRCGHPADFPDRDDWGCTKKLFRAQCAMGVYPCAYDGLDKVAAHFGLTGEGDRHTALHDAQLALRCLERIWQDFMGYRQDRAA